MCKNVNSRYLKSLACVEPPNADFYTNLNNVFFDLNLPLCKKSTEFDAHSFEDHLVRPIRGPMSDPKKFNRKQNPKKREARGKWQCRCVCSKRDIQSEIKNFEGDIELIEQFCEEQLRKHQEQENDTHRDEPLFPGDAQDSIVAPGPACSRIDEEVDCVVGRDEGWCLIEHDVEVDGPKDLLKRVECQS